MPLQRAPRGSARRGSPGLTLSPMKFVVSCTLPCSHAFTCETWQTERMCLGLASAARLLRLWAEADGGVSAWLPAPPGRALAPQL